MDNTRDGAVENGFSANAHDEMVLKRVSLGYWTVGSAAE